MYGTRRCVIDAKDRLTLPADIRKSFPDKHVVLVPFNNECLYGFTPESFEEWVRSIFRDKGNEYNERNESHRKIMRKIRGGAVELVLDSAGRLALGKLDAVDESLRPGRPTRRQRLGIERDVMVVGNGDRFEIWNADRWIVDDDETEEDFYSMFNVE